MDMDINIVESAVCQAILDGELRAPLPGFTLDEVRIRPVYSEVAPHQVDLATDIGPLQLNFPLFSAAMDTVSGPQMAQVLAEVGGCGVIYRHKRPEIQLEWLKQALEHRPCLIAEPETLYPDQPLEYAAEILRKKHFSTIPVVLPDQTLQGVLFTKGLAFKSRQNDRVAKWMTPLKELKVVDTEVSFEAVKTRLLNEQECSVLPVIDDQRKLVGIYFMKDFLQANPALHSGRPAVGLAVGVGEEDLERVREGLKLGVAAIVVDSSHGNCPAVINQAAKIVKLAGGQAAVIAGNVADIDGYFRLAQAGVDAVKCGIGSGSICTTSQVTGAGVPMFSLISELQYTRAIMLEKRGQLPAIIADGGVSGSGNLVVALAAGSHAGMAGEWLAAAAESLSYQEHGAPDGYVYYRGMASKGAIEDRSSDRYGKQKRAPEGEIKRVRYRGPLKSWIGDDIELVQGGFAHAGARDLKALHQFGQWPLAFVRFSPAGQGQIAAKI